MNSRAVIAAALALSIATGAQAQTDEHVKGCTNVAEFAAAVMTARQAGVPMDKVYGIIPTSDPTFASGARQLVAHVYTRYSVYPSEPVKELAISNFRSQWFAGCIKNYPAK